MKCTGNEVMHTWAWKCVVTCQLVHSHFGTMAEWSIDSSDPDASDLDGPSAWSISSPSSEGSSSTMDADAAGEIADPQEACAVEFGFFSPLIRAASREELGEHAIAFARAIARPDAAREGDDGDIDTLVSKYLGPLPAMTCGRSLEASLMGKDRKTFGRAVVALGVAIGLGVRVWLGALLQHLAGHIDAGRYTPLAAYTFLLSDETSLPVGRHRWRSVGAGGTGGRCRSGATIGGGRCQSGASDGGRRREQTCRVGCRADLPVRICCGLVVEGYGSRPFGAFEHPGTVQVAERRPRHWRGYCRAMA